MPPKVKITKEEIIQTALFLVRENGEQAINARAIATALHCSTQPILRHSVLCRHKTQLHFAATRLHVPMLFHCHSLQFASITKLRIASPLLCNAVPIYAITALCFATASQHFATLCLCRLSISAPKQCSIAHCYYSAMRFFAIARLVFATPQLGISVPLPCLSSPFLNQHSASHFSSATAHFVSEQRQNNAPSHIALTKQHFTLLHRCPSMRHLTSPMPSISAHRDTLTLQFLTILKHGITLPSS
jgi:hypothetical protein